MYAVEVPTVVVTCGPPSVRTSLRTLRRRPHPHLPDRTTEYGGRQNVTVKELETGTLVLSPFPPRRTYGIRHDRLHHRRSSYIEKFNRNF